jgi:hypothetical protein
MARASQASRGGAGTGTTPPSGAESPISSRGGGSLAPVAATLCADTAAAGVAVVDDDAPAGRGHVWLFDCSSHACSSQADGEAADAAGAGACALESTCCIL